jgi:hypothetical protein
MPTALLLKTNGEYEKVSPKTVEEYQKYIGGYVERLPINRGYVNPNKKSEGRFNLVCYADEEGLFKDMPINPYAGLLSVLGVTLAMGIYIYGPVLVFSEDTKNDGEEANIDPYIVELIEQYNAVEEDEDAFFVALEELNEPPKKSKRKRLNREVEDKKKSDEPLISHPLCLSYLQSAKYCAPEKYRVELEGLIQKMSEEVVV